MQLHWPDPPYPIEDPSPELGLLMAMFAVVLVFVVGVLYATKSSGSLPQPGQQADEKNSEEKESS